MNTYNSQRKGTIVITGISGGIGSELCRYFQNQGWRVHGIDCVTPDFDIELFHSIDLNQYCRNPDYRSNNKNALLMGLPDGEPVALINNAAIQIVKPAPDIELTEWQTTLDINVTAAFLLSIDLLPKLKQVQGTIVNIGSIHAKLTKPGFVAYATSKAALVGLTKSLAVDLGNKVRVVAISPAAVNTSMLVEGLAAQGATIEDIENKHPIGRIANPQEIAALVGFLVSKEATFITGSEIQIDGGIASRLHDI